MALLAHLLCVPEFVVARARRQAKQEPDRVATAYVDAQHIEQMSSQNMQLICKFYLLITC